jgi:deferrochelatase/peroxidase EfeB
LVVGNTNDDTPFLSQKISRRNALALVGTFGAGVALGGGGTLTVRALADPGQTVQFYGKHQAGIATPQQDRLHFASFDLTVSDAGEVRELMREWSEAAAKMCAGQPVGDENANAFVPPEDTGEAQDLTAGRLTVTFGFGPTLFEMDGEDRFGLAYRKPAALREIPVLPGDNLEPGLSGGDLCVQACSDDPQVAFHAVRNLARIGRGAAVIRWSQLGFGRTSSTSSEQQTPRNLMGFKDGTNNIRAENTDLMDRYVWVKEGPDWMKDGTYLVARRIRMLIEVWDRTALQEQEQTIGRHRASGAPLGKTDEFDAVDLEAKGPDGLPLTPLDSHVRLARKDRRERILRRGYSFTDGMDQRTGQLDAGLFFISFQRDPHKQFVPLQRRLGQTDRLNEYIQHTGSALFACPPGAGRDGFVGQHLFA